MISNDDTMSQTNKKEIKDLTPVRGQDGKISDTQGCLEIFPSCPLTGV